MKKSFLACALLAGLFSCTKKDNYISLPTSDSIRKPLDPTPAASVPRPDHIIIVWFENHSYSQIVGNSLAPYINSLIPKATLLTNMSAITHPSYPNYIAMFSGSTQGVSSDACLLKRPFNTPNLYTVLHNVSYSFAWYSEDLPRVGAVVCSYNNYHQKHNPVTAFSNVPDIANKPLSTFDWNDTSDENMATLETVVCITPNKLHSMHDQNITRQADQWLQSNFSNLIEWCRTHNSIFVIDYDEGTSKSNKIALMLLGAHVRSNFKLSTPYNHYSVTKSIANAYGADSTYNANLVNATSITGCFF